MCGQVIKQMRDNEIKNLKHGDKIEYNNQVSISFNIESEAIFMCVHEKTGELIIETRDGLRYMPSELFIKVISNDRQEINGEVNE